ncbi:MAG: c-type cytochrome biogenesis protein CcsB [Nitrospirota bacterium]
MEGNLSRDLFLLHIELRLFWVVAILYSICFLAYLSHCLAPRSGAGRIASGILWITVILHTLLIAFRTIEGERPPFQTLYETLSWFAWFSSITYLFIEKGWNKIYTPGIIVSLIAVSACLYSLLTRSPEIAPLPPALQSPWYEWHVVVAFTAYAVFVVSFAVEVVYLIFKPMRDETAYNYGLSKDVREDFHRYAHRLVLFGFPLLAFAIFSGAAWANEAWGRYWSWDPKETWSLTTWTVYAIYIHSMRIKGWREMLASLLNLFGFVCMIMTFLGVNWLVKLLDLPSMHAY